MYQRVCRSDYENSVAFQEDYALKFYGIGRKGNLNTLNQKVKQANGGKADLTKVRPAVIASALSEMIAKGHGTLAANPLALKLKTSTARQCQPTSPMRGFWDRPRALRRTKWQNMTI